MCKHMSVTIVDSHPALVASKKYVVVCLECGQQDIKLTEFFD